MKKTGNDSIFATLSLIKAHDWHFHISRLTHFAAFFFSLTTYTLEHISFLSCCREGNRSALKNHKTYVMICWAVIFNFFFPSCGAFNDFITVSHSQYFFFFFVCVWRWTRQLGKQKVISCFVETKEKKNYLRGESRLIK